MLRARRNIMKNRRLALTLAALAAAGFAFAATPAGALTDKDRPEVEAIIKDYLVKHPEVLRDALESLEKMQASEESKKQSAVIAANHKVIFDSPRGPSIGNPNGDVTLVEFFDYNCGYCKHALGDVMKLVKDDPKLKVVLKEFPVLGPGSVDAAKVAVAVRMQDSGHKYFEFHKRLLGGRGEANKERALAAAKDAGFDIARIQKDMESPEVANTLRESMGIAQALGINGTPTFIVANEMVVGAMGYDALKSKIDAVRKCGMATCLSPLRAAMRASREARFRHFATLARSDAITTGRKRRGRSAAASNRPDSSHSPRPPSRGRGCRGRPTDPIPNHYPSRPSRRDDGSDDRRDGGRPR
jgi:protein-disulfide isomerase